MNGIARLLLSLLCIGLLAACTKSDSSTEMIEPGDKLGDFLITTGEEGEVTFGDVLACKEQAESGHFACHTTVGTKVMLTTGIYDETASGKLDELWTEFSKTYKMTIDGRPVDLPPFGTLDRVHPMVGTIRYFNVVIDASKPGEMTISDSGELDGEAIQETTVLTFTEP